MTVWVKSTKYLWELQYADDYPAFASDILGLKLWDKATEILWAFQTQKNTCIRGCFESGKTCIAAACLLCFMYTEPDAKGVTSAPTGRQVKDLLWGEVRSLHARAKFELGGECLTQYLNIDREKWFAVGFKASDYNEEAMQGYHGRRTCLILDEATGLTRTVLGAKDKIILNDTDRCLALGNPTDPLSPYKDWFSSKDFYKIHISAFDIPNVKWPDKPETHIPGLLKHEWVEWAKETWGEDSPYYIARVLADWPENNTDSMYPLSWIEAANRRYIELEKLIEAGKFELEGDKVCGVDVARLGSADTVFAKRIKYFWMPFERYHGLETTQVSSKVVVASKQGYHCCIDAVGIGAGVVDEARADGVNCTAVNAGGKASFRDETLLNEFLNKRTELHWRLRDVLDPRNGYEPAIPPDDNFKEEAATIKWKQAAHGKIKIEDKEQLSKRLGRSPDTLDAVTLSLEQRGSTEHAADFYKNISAGDGEEILTLKGNYD